MRTFQIYKLVCKHSYCEGCITTWLERSSTCPYCRENINYDNFYKIEVEVYFSE